jgi:hypothetical protein
MSNIYEELLLFCGKEKCEKLIASLIKKERNNPEITEELNQISKVIQCSVEITDACSWNNCPSVSVWVEGLTEDASEEAKTLWEAQSKEQERQDRLDWKRQRLEQAQKQLLELQAEIAAAEANA